MQTEPRVTRSRAKALNTPLTEALPYAGTTSKKATKKQGSANEELPRKALFELPNTPIVGVATPKPPAGLKTDSKRSEIKVKTSQGETFNAAGVPEQASETLVSTQQLAASPAAVPVSAARTPANRTGENTPLACPQTQELQELPVPSITGMRVATPATASPQQPVKILVDRIESRVATPCSVPPPVTWGFLNPGQTPLIPQHVTSKLGLSPLQPSTTGFGSPITAEDAASTPLSDQTGSAPGVQSTPKTQSALQSPVHTVDLATELQEARSITPHLLDTSDQLVPSPVLYVATQAQATPSAQFVAAAPDVVEEAYNSSTPDSMRAEINSLSSPLNGITTPSLTPDKTATAEQQSLPSSSKPVTTEIPEQGTTIPEFQPDELAESSPVPVFDTSLKPPASALETQGPVFAVLEDISEEIISINVQTPVLVQSSAESASERPDIEDPVPEEATADVEMASNESVTDFREDQEEDAEQSLAQSVGSKGPEVASPLGLGYLQDAAMKDALLDSAPEHTTVSRLLSAAVTQVAADEPAVSTQSFATRVAKLDAANKKQDAEVAKVDRWPMDGELQSPLAPKVVVSTGAQKVKMPSKVDSSSYDPRSLRQLKKEVKSKLQPKANLPGLKASPANSAASSIYTDVHQLPKSGAIDEEEVTSLTQAVQGMHIVAQSPEPLKGVPVPQGKHIRFDEEGNVEEAENRTLLRGVPKARGTHIRFD